MGAVRKALLLRRKRGGNGSASRTAGEHHVASSGVWDGGRIERGQRNNDGLGKAFDRCFIGLADVDEHETAILQALGDLLRRQIAHLRVLIRHLCSPALAAS